MKKLLCGVFVLILIVFNCYFVFAQGPGVPKLNGIAFDGSGLYVAVGDRGVILTSADGVNWSERQSHVDKNLYDITWGKNQFAAVGEGGITLISTDGVNWALGETDNSADLQSIACNGEQFVAVGDSGTVLVSASGVKWNRIRMATMESLMSVRWLNGRYMAVGGGMLILTSADGITWEEIMSERSNLQFMDVFWNGSRYVVVGDHIAILTSEDGKVWTYRGSDKVSEETGVDFTRSLYSIVWGKDRFLSVGHWGSIISSSDGVTWSGEDQVTRRELRDIVWGKDKYIAAGDEGTILVSYDGSEWEDLRKLTIDSKEYTMTMGQEKQLKVMLRYPYGTEVDITGDAAYEVEGKDVAYVDEKGVLKALGPGQVEVRVLYDQKSVKVPVKVSEPIADGDDDLPEEKDTGKQENVDKDTDGNDIVIKVIIGLAVLSVLAGALVFYLKKINRHVE